MKNLFRTNIVIVLCLLITACGQVAQVAPSTVPPTDTATETKTPFPTITPLPSAIVTVASTPKPIYVPPTLIPTIDPTLVPNLLRNAFSIQVLDLNGYNTQRITGWDLGFGATADWYIYCPSYVWLDTNHILLYPITGQTTQPIQGDMRAIEVVPQPVVINVESGSLWLPPVDLSSGSSCNDVYLVT